jgi:hypothetical protein
MEPGDELYSFPFCQEVDRVEHAYRITAKGGHLFAVEKDGAVIAELTNSMGWRQTSGEPLEKGLMDKICNRIDAHYA